MSRLFLSISFLLITLSSFGQEQAFLDSVLSVPYDGMVSDLARSEKGYTQALETAQDHSNDSARAKLLSKLNIIQYLLGNKDESLRLGLQAIELHEKLGNRNEVGGLYCSIGYGMWRRDLPKANEYMRKGIAIQEALNDSSSLSGSYDNYGVLKEIEEQLDSATFYYNRSLDFKAALNDSIGIPYSLNKLAGVLMIRKDATAAKKLFDQAFEIRSAINDEYGIAENLIYYGEFQLEFGQMDSAVFYFNRCIEKAKEVGYPYLIQYSYEQLSEAYTRQGNFDLALSAHRSAVGIKDSLNTETRTKEIALLETRFETEQKEKENLILKQEKAEDALALSRQRFLIGGLAGAAILILLLGFIFTQRNKQKARAEKDAAIIEERESGLEGIINATEEERKRIAKDLHDGIVQTLTGLRLKLDKQIRSLPDLPDEKKSELKDGIGILDDAIAETRGISHQMMPRALSEAGLIPALQDMLEKSLGQTNIEFEFEEHGIGDKRFDERKEISLYRICQELVNNIIKHSEAKAVSVQLLATKSHLILVVEDNGKGFEYGDPSNQNGIGLMNINTRAQSVHGDVNYQPSPEQGTVATIRVPL